MRLRFMPLMIVALSASGVAFAQDDTKTIDKIRLLRGVVQRNRNLPGNPVVAVSFMGSKRFNGKFLHLLKEMDSLTYLDLRKTQITDEQLAEVSELEQLTVLRLSDVPITNTGLKELRGNNLVSLDLGGTQITDAGLKDLRELSSLKYLHLNATNITGEGLSNLRDLPFLLSLNLENTQLNDAGLMHARELKHVIRINIRNTKVTEEGVKGFNAAMPNVRTYGVGSGPANKFEDLEIRVLR